LFLEAIQPAQLEVSLATLEEIESRTRQVDRQWELRQERARYEADLARRRFLAVDPENRLVARTLEKDWNEKLATAEELERERAVATAAAALPLSPDERRRILDLAEDLPALWHAPTTTPAERKQLLRLLIKYVTLTKGAATITAAVRWQTGARTPVDVPRPPRSCDAKRTPAAVVDRVRTLAADHTDRQIAERLNTDGCKSGGGGIFTASKVQWVRYAHKIGRVLPNDSTREPGEREDGRCSARAAAQALNVTVSTVADWCKDGRLDGMQAMARGAWWIRLTPEVVAQLRKPVRRRWTRRSPG
jgi:hypothetical protein